MTGDRKSAQNKKEYGDEEEIMDDSDGYKHGYSQDGTDCFLWLESVALTLMPSFSSCFFALDSAPRRQQGRLYSTKTPSRVVPEGRLKREFKVSLISSLCFSYVSSSRHVFLKLSNNLLRILFTDRRHSLNWIFQDVSTCTKGNRAPSSSTSPTAAWALRMLRGANVSAGQFKLT